MLHLYGGARRPSNSRTLQEKRVRGQTSSCTFDLLYQVIYSHHSKELCTLTSPQPCRPFNCSPLFSFQKPEAKLHIARGVSSGHFFSALLLSDISALCSLQFISHVRLWKRFSNKLYMIFYWWTSFRGLL